ncbi:MAG: ATP-binding protein [Anaerolineaceae bacterium]|jgi:signal transduction histidine kinase|nr:ATP-binding protein [Anaerolineaceae bacterium]
MNKRDDLTFQRYQRLIEISRDLASTLDLDGLLRRIASNAVELSKAETASILLYDEKNDQLYFQVVTDPENETIMRGIVVPGDSIAGWVARNRQPVIVPDVHKDKRFFQNVEKTLDFKTRNIIATPMITKGKLIGVLETLNKTDGIFNQEDQDTLMVLSAQAAVAIENSRLFQQADHIAELVHELRTPLTSISTISYLLQQPNVSEEDRMNMAVTVQEEASRLTRLTTNFLDVARLESGRAIFNPTKVDLREILKESVEINAHKANEKQIRIMVDLAKDLPLIEADRDKLKQVVLNLLSNAVKYNREQGSIFIRAYPDDTYLILSIEDTGFGIPEDEFPLLFTKFFRSQHLERRAEGTGLGLSISKFIIDSHGGKIQAKSKVDEGTIFTVSLPIKHG